MTTSPNTSNHDFAARMLLLASAAWVPAISASADQAGGHFYFSTDVGVSLMQDVDIDAFLGLPADGTASFDPGVRFGLAGGYAFPSRSARLVWRAELESGLAYNQADELSGPGGSVSLDASLYQIPVLANVILDIKATPKLTPYVGVGGGVAFAHLDFDGVADLAGDASDTETVGAFQGLAGLRWALGSRSELGLAYRFLGTGEPSWDLSGAEVGAGSLFSHSIVASFKFNF